MSVYLDRTARLIEILADKESDTAWIIVPENRRYLSGYTAEDTSLTESSGSLLINEKTRMLVTDSRYTLQAEKEARDFDVHTVNQNLSEEFCSLVSDTGAENLGFEEEYLTWARHRDISDKLSKLSPPVLLTPLDSVVEGMRMVKDRFEIHTIGESAAMISDILDDIIDTLEPGISEKEVAWNIMCLARDRGAEGLAFPSIVASGPNSALPHAVPTDRKIGPHEPVIIDVGVRLNGYCSDITRTVFMGEPSRDLKDMYRTVKTAQLRAIEGIRPGMKTDEVDAMARDLIRDAGYGEYFGHALGHGVGLAVHEGPRLGPNRPVELETGVVVTVEPGIYVPGLGGVRLEEMVLVEEEGARVLTKAGHMYDF